MKLGKKKTGDASGDEKPAKNNKKAAAGSKLKKLNSVAATQALVVVLAGVLAAALVHFLAVQPAAIKRFDVEKAIEAESAALRMNQYLSLMQAGVNGLADRPDVIAAVSEPGGIVATEESLASALPGIQGVHLFPYRQIPRTANERGALGFAGLELLRRAENGQPLHPDAFPRDNRWLVQMATPVRNPVSNAVIGSLLVIFD
ncbi:MAG: phosphomannomutase/phosphoglucomutase, partial [Marinobacter alexandrii]